MPANKFLVKRPIVTEKAVSLGQMGKYAFLVEAGASASEVKKVIETTYNVKVVNTNVINTKSRQSMWGNHMKVRPGYKKVLVTLQKGQKLDILPQ